MQLITLNKMTRWRSRGDGERGGNGAMDVHLIGSERDMENAGRINK